MCKFSTKETCKSHLLRNDFFVECSVTKFYENVSYSWITSDLDEWNIFPQEKMQKLFLFFQLLYCKQVTSSKEFCLVCWKTAVTGHVPYKAQQTTITIESAIISQYEIIKWLLAFFNISTKLESKEKKIPLDIVWISMIGLVGRVFANGPGDLGSIPGCVFQRLKKWYLIPPCLTLSNIKYVSRIKWSNPGKGVALSPPPRCSSYQRGSLLVILD